MFFWTTVCTILADHRHQLFFDVFTSKLEICRTTFTLVHFGQLIFFLA
jgi:hypothetical protein